MSRAICDKCGGTSRVEVYTGGRFCDPCILSEIPRATAVIHTWTSNEDHFGGLNYLDAKVTS